MPHPIIAKTATVEYIVAPCAAHPLVVHAAAVFAVPLGELLGPSRARHIVRARWAAMAVLRLRTDMSLQAIASAVGRADHSTVVSGLRAGAALAQADARFARAFADLLHGGAS
jgi:chromosomal replication initiation ATPase DnaA